jgi:hypothetical protein
MADGINVLDNKKYQDFFSTFLDTSEYKKLQQYLSWWVHITYWKNHPDKDRGEKNIEEIKKNLPSLKYPVQELLKANKKLKNGLGIYGCIFHELAVKEFPNLLLSKPLKIQKSTHEFSYSVNEYKVLVALLLSLDINPNDVDSFFKQSSLCAAIGFDNIPFTLALLEFTESVDVNQPCSQSFCSSTPLLLSIQRGQAEVYAKLMERADVNKPDKFGLTALHWAMIMGDDIALSLLLSHPDIKIQAAHNGKFPLDYENISKEAFGFCYNKYGHFLANQTSAPEFRPIIAHFCNNREAFLEYRETRRDNIQKCAEMIRVWQPSVPIQQLTLERRA